MDEMHFISEQGDTLSVADPLTVDLINVGDTHFYYEQGRGYLQAIDTAGKITQAFRQSFTEEPQHPGAFGMTVPHEGATTYTYFTSKGEQYKLNENDKVTLSTKESYFFGDEHRHFFKTGKEFILDHYPKRQPEIKSLLKANHINFNNAEDMMKLLQYCSAPGT